MQDLYALKEMLCKELKNYGKKGELTAGSLEVIDKLAHALKNLNKVIEEEQYSSRSYDGGGSYRGSYAYENGSMSNGGSYARSMDDGSYGSYARGRGSGARRDSMGRYASAGYSRNNDLVMELRELMQDARDESTRMELEKFINKMESM